MTLLPAVRDQLAAAAERRAHRAHATSWTRRVLRQVGENGARSRLRVATGALAAMTVAVVVWMSEPARAPTGGASGASGPGVTARTRAATLAPVFGPALVEQLQTAGVRGASDGSALSNAAFGVPPT